MSCLLVGDNNDPTIKTFIRATESLDPRKVSKGFQKGLGRGLKGSLKGSLKGFEGF